MNIINENLLKEIIDVDSLGKAVWYFMMLKSQQRFRSKKRHIFTEKVPLSAEADKRIQSYGVSGGKST